MNQSKEMTQLKKRQKTDRQQVVKNTDLVSKFDEVFVAEKFVALVFVVDTFLTEFFGAGSVNPV